MSEADENDLKPDVEPASPMPLVGLPGRMSAWVTRLRETAGQRKWVLWLAGLIVFGAVGWYSKRHYGLSHFHAWLNTGSKVIADPSHLVEVLLGVGALVVLTLWLLPKWQAAGSQGISIENRFDRENEARKTLAQIFGGVFLLAGLYSSVNAFNLQRQTEARLREGQINDRLDKASAQLSAVSAGGGVDLEMRLNGIRALGRIAHESPANRWAIMETLTSYIRTNSPNNIPFTRPALCDAKQAVGSIAMDSPKAHRDIQTALTLIGEHNSSPGSTDGRLNLDRTDLSGANLIGVDFTGATFNWSNLRGAFLDHALLSRAGFYQADLRGARLTMTDLSNSQLVQANLSDAKLDGINLAGARLVSARLDRAFLPNSHFAGTNLYMACLNDVDFTQSHELPPSQLSGAYGNSKTRLPPELLYARPASWRK